MQTSPDKRQEKLVESFFVFCYVTWGASLVAQLVKNLPTMRETWAGKMPWRRERLPAPVFWPGEFHVLYSPWGRKGSDTTEQLSLTHRLPGTQACLPQRHLMQ